MPSVLASLQSLRDVGEADRLYDEAWRAKLEARYGAAPVVRGGALVGVLLVEQSRPSSLSAGDDVLVASALAGLYAAALDAPESSEPVAEAVAPEVGARRDSWPSPGGRA